MTKHILIPWSGGLDSTYLIYDAIQKGHKVTTCSFSLKQNTQQSNAGKTSNGEIKN